MSLFELLGKCSSSGEKVAIIIVRRFSWAVPERPSESIHLYLSFLILFNTASPPASKNASLCLVC